MNSTDTVINPLGGVPQPTNFGKYIVQEKIGEGAMGSVFKAYDPSIDRIVAIKTISPSILSADISGEFKARFLREIRAIGKNNHTNIISIFDNGELNGNPFFVMEYVEGKELKELLKNGSTLSMDNSNKLISQILDALSYSHECGIVHRDIKPSNLFINIEGNVKIADFGIAKQTNSDLTQLGSIIGTPSYMSPEQCQGKQVDHRSDLFSTAVVFYEMLTGEKCFPGSSSHTIMHKTISSTPEKPSKLNLHIPKSLDHVILKALSKSPNDRYQTANEFKDAIQNALSKKAYTTNKKRFYTYVFLIFAGALILGSIIAFSNNKFDGLTHYIFGLMESTHMQADDITHVKLSKQNKITRLLKVANAHKLVGRIVAPQGSNAYATYKIILSIDPNNIDAKKGLQQVNNLLFKQIKTWISQDNIENAKTDIDVALGLFPDDDRFIKLSKIIRKK